MKLSEFLELNELDYDTGDDVFDAVVTVCYCENFAKSLKAYRDGEKLESVFDWYDVFCGLLYEKIEVISGGEYPVCDWYYFIERNMKLFKAFTRDFWYRDYADKDDFIYEWINELDQYLAGNVGEGTYKTMVKLLEQCK